MGVKPTRDPSLPPVDKLPKSFSSPIALIGAGPATLSCATFLSRLGYQNVTIFEKNQYAGGLTSSEIPQFRLDQHLVDWEVEMVRDMGVKIEYGKELGKDLKGSDMLKNYAAVFIGVGKTDPIEVPELKGISREQGYHNSKTFLPHIAELSKGLTKQGDRKMYNFKGQRVVVLGAGDTAMDCSSAALRCGARQVTVVMRRNTDEIRAAKEEREFSFEEGVDVLAYHVLKSVIRNKDGKITAAEFYQTEKDENGKWVTDKDQFIRMKVDAIISAFGSRTSGVVSTEFPGLAMKWGNVVVDDNYSTAVKGLFAGGDVCGAGLTVMATNDGKSAAWSIHKFLSGEKLTIDHLPNFYTDIDKIDLSVEMCGIKFENPFGLASAPPCTSGPMIDRAFEEGWGFAVTKTYAIAEDAGITNVSPRIYSASWSGQDLTPQQPSFINVELISEKNCDYWYMWIEKLKKKHPTKIIIASIMASKKKESWQELARKSEAAGADAIEMNLSCPHGMHEIGMGLALGSFPELVQMATEWVKEAVSIPVFPKLTPNVTDIAAIAGGAKKGGADGITAINTISGLVGFHNDANPMRWGVGHGDEKKVSFGGFCGNAVRPVALKMVAAVAQAHGAKEFPIMGVGSVDSADVTLQMLYAGATVVQICSAVMNQDFTIIQDLKSGLRTLLMMRGHKAFKKFDHQKVVHSSKLVPSFGAREEERRENIHKVNLENFEKGKYTRPSSAPEPVEEKDLFSNIPSVNDMVGLGLKNVGDHMVMSRKEQVYAEIDNDTCLNCGRCMMACNDSGYQAIYMDGVTHELHVDIDTCTGCGLCESVCPAQDCITYENRPEAIPPNRGMDEGAWVPEGGWKIKV